jgi:hypothetical protein
MIRLGYPRQVKGHVVERLDEAEDDLKAEISHYHEHMQQEITHGTALVNSQLASSTLLLDGTITTTGAQV